MAMLAACQMLMRVPPGAAGGDIEKLLEEFLVSQGE
jgi:hypothetical protein